MRLKDIKTIDVFTRGYHDAENGNPYYARKIVVNMGLQNEQTFTLGMTWGSVEHIGNDHIERILKLPKSISFTDCKMFRYINYRPCEVKSIRYTYHKALRVYRESSLEHPERFKNL